MPDLQSDCPQRILVIDDEPGVVDLVALTLESAGFEVWKATSVDQALQVIAGRGLPHLALVDIRMPGRDGFAFCEAVHDYSDLPCMMLTAVGNKETVVIGLERHAEDYITKPFHLQELVARVRRVLLRVPDLGYAQSPLVRVDDCLSIDFAHQHALVNGDIVLLTPTETKILFILMGHAGNTVRTEYLLKRLWPMREVYEDSLRVHVHRLRHKIDPSPGSACHLITERGVGYRFEPGMHAWRRPADDRPPRPADRAASGK